jgi:hypothetical protein
MLLRISSEMRRYIVHEAIGAGRERWTVDNPAAAGDNLADRMNSTPERQQAFLIWHDKFHKDLVDLIQQAGSAQGIDTLVKRASAAYGTAAGRAIADAAAKAIEAQRAARRVSFPARATSAAGAVAAPTIALASQPHRFFGR